MFRDIGAPELLIVLVIIILVFGVGRISKIFGELGSGIRSFQKGLKGDEKNSAEQNPESEDESKISEQK
jgi:sec-independent protein translocase protein TatA